MAPRGNSAPLLIGKATGYPYFTGELDEVGLYAGLLPAARIAAHRNAARGLS